MNQPQNYTIIQLIREPEKVVEVGEQLLKSEDWSEVMSALVLMTGLKCDLLLTATTIEQKTAYSVVFTESTSSEETVREIPTLTLVENVIKALKLLRNTIETNHLESRSINANYLPTVINACDRHFKKLIPNSSTKNSRYTQIYRAVYGTIATYWYCPPDVSPIDYKAYICGQEKIMEGKQDTIKEKIAVQLHYYEYQIGVNRKKIDERVGIKLDNPLVKIIEKFQPLITITEDSNVLESLPQLISEKIEDIDPQKLIVLQLQSENIKEVLEGLKQATGCSPSQLLLSNIYEVKSKDGEVQLVLKEGKIKQMLPNLVEGETIIKAISKLRKDPSIQELLEIKLQKGWGN